jgi:hypothetical protein
MSEAIDYWNDWNVTDPTKRKAMKLVKPLGTAHSAEDRSALIWQPGNFRMAKYV